jgi:hypothetical protein
MESANVIVQRAASRISGRAEFANEPFDANVDVFVLSKIEQNLIILIMYQ